jgi:hypothetical protein
MIKSSKWTGKKSAVGPLEVKGVAKWTGGMLLVLSGVIAPVVGACTFESSREVLTRPDGGSDQVDGGTDPGGSGGSGTTDGGTPIGAPPVLITLSETVSDVVTPGAGAICANQGGRTTANQVWYRVFRPADFGAQAGFRVTEVRFAAAIAKSARGIRVHVGTYAGAVGASSLTPVDIAISSTVTLDVPDGGASGTTPRLIHVPIVGQIPAGANLVIEIESPDLGPVGGMFVLGATTASETAPGYFSADACFQPLPQAESALGIAGHFVIEAVGTPD